MKVKCINNNDWPNFLTKGKTYEVIRIRIDDEGDYVLIDDECWYLKYLFKPLSELRNETINKLLE